MKNLKLLNNFVFKVLIIFIFSLQLLATEPIDIWKSSDELENEPIKEEEIISESKKNLLLKNKESSNIGITQENNENLKFKKVYGLFEPEENNLSLDMWKESDGEILLRILGRLKKKNLSSDSENLLIKTLFTISYPPDQNIKPYIFLNYKLEWLIDNKKINIIENFLEKNTGLKNNSILLKFLIEEYLSRADIGKACKKLNFFYKSIDDDFLDKFKIYCLIKKKNIEAAQLQYDLLIDRGFKDKFYEGKINYMLGYNEKPNLKISDQDLFNLHLSHVVNKNFQYVPTSKTSKYIWRYLSSNNLLSNPDSINLDDEKTVNLYEKAASQNTYDKSELFDLYKNILFNINQILNVEEVYKTLPTYKARALVYQSVLLSEDLQRKFNLLVLLNDLFKKDNIENAFSEELLLILEKIDKNKIPEKHLGFYKYVVNSKSLRQNLKKIKFDNKILHRSKLIKFFQEDYEIEKVEKDLKNIYKKIRKNKDYYFSIKDTILLDSLKADGVNLPKGLIDQYESQSKNEQLVIPQQLIDWTDKKQTGLVLLKLVEIIGEDNLEDLDPETLFFITTTLNKLSLKKIRNNIIVKTLPSRV